jgi:ATP-dependent 26S proteasome regulatory subunit
MARSDLLVGLVKAASRSDDQGFRRALEALVADERGKHHHVLADRLAEYLGPSTNGFHVMVPPTTTDEGIAEVLHSRRAQRTFESLTLPDHVRQALAAVVEEQSRKELLRAHGLEPRHRIMLIGPPGNGKTSAAEAISEALMLPMYVARYEGIVGSFLGETSGRLKKVFDFARTRPCVLFFDEFDTLGKERGDPHDTGEIKRVVSGLLLQIDDLPSHVVVITATNHAELLDRAAWRRFEVRLYLPPPTPKQISDRIAGLALAVGADAEPAERLLSALRGASFSDLEEVETDVRRRLVLGQGGLRASQVLVDVVRDWATQQEAVRSAVNG